MARTTKCKKNCDICGNKYHRQEMTEVKHSKWSPDILSVCLVVIFGLYLLSGVKDASEDYKKEITEQEFEIVSCYVELRNRTNMVGGLLGTDKYLHYGYLNSDGKVTFEEICFEKEFDFRLTEGVPKVIITTDENNKTYVFELTREIYNNLISNRE